MLTAWAAAATTGMPSARAAESASGAYLLGLRGPGAGLTPPEGLYFSTQTFIYEGDISGRLRFEGGTLASRAELAPIINVPTLLWMTPAEIGGARVGASITAPFGRVAVKGQVGPLLLEDDVTTFADPSLSLFLGGRAGQLHWQLGVTGFLPIGDYQRGALANVSKNRGALDVFGAATWLVPDLGLDVTNVIGVTFNDTNEATDYRTGTEFHWEWAVSRKFDSGFSLGAVGYLYEQLTGDTGTGAILGEFKGRSVAVGPVIGYDFKIGAVPISTRARVYFEVETERRFEGTAGFLSLSMPLWVPGAR